MLAPYCPPAADRRPGEEDNGSPSVEPDMARRVREPNRPDSSDGTCQCHTPSDRQRLKSAPQSLQHQFTGMGLQRQSRTGFPIRKGSVSRGAGGTYPKILHSRSHANSQTQARPHVCRSKTDGPHPALGRAVLPHAAGRAVLPYAAWTGSRGSSLGAGS
jgi:hypothetical protein